MKANRGQPRFFYCMRIPCFALLVLTCISCGAGPTPVPVDKPTSANETAIIKDIPLPDTTIRSIHVYVALCDNKYQGIVPVNAKVGNGQDPANNLYWGWGYGIKTYFKNSKEWKLIRSQKQTGSVLERLLFRHATDNYYLIADAYDGREMKKCITDFLTGLSGKIKDTIMTEGKVIGTAGNAKLLSFIGHDGLMDFQLTDKFEKADSMKRDCIILACYSKNYFSPFVHQTGAYPLLWTTNLMGPEAYTIHDAITGYIKKESAASMQMRAAKAYSSYTKCTVKAAMNLLVTGW
jgi:hypothetical protein